MHRAESRIRQRASEGGAQAHIHDSVTRWRSGKRAMTRDAVCRRTGLQGAPSHRHIYREHVRDRLEVEQWLRFHMCSHKARIPVCQKDKETGGPTCGPRHVPSVPASDRGGRLGAAVDPLCVVAPRPPRRRDQYITGAV